MARAEPSGTAVGHRHGSAATLAGRRRTPVGQPLVRLSVIVHVPGLHAGGGTAPLAGRQLLQGWSQTCSESLRWRRPPPAAAAAGCEQQPGQGRSTSVGQYQMLRELQAAQGVGLLCTARERLPEGCGNCIKLCTAVGSSSDRCKLLPLAGTHRCQRDLLCGQLHGHLCADMYSVASLRVSSGSCSACKCCCPAGGGDGRSVLGRVCMLPERILQPRGNTVGCECNHMQKNYSSR